MVKWFFAGFVVLMVATSAVSRGQGSGQRDTQATIGKPPTAQQGGRVRGAADANRTVTGFGTTNTLTTMPEAGAGSAADDPTPEQLATSKEAQAIIANAKKIAGAD